MESILGVEEPKMIEVGKVFGFSKWLEEHCIYT